MVRRARIALAIRGRHCPASNHRQTRSGLCRDDETPAQTVGIFPSKLDASVHIIQFKQPQTQQIAPIICQMILSTIHFTAHTPAMKSLHSVGPRLNSSWAAAASDPSEECMVTVSTLERQHMASWGGTASTSNRATLSRGSHRRPGTDPSLNGHKPANSTEKREHCEYPSSRPCVCVAFRVGKGQSCSLLWQRQIIGTTF